jgi:hypothetical protein
MKILWIALTIMVAFALGKRVLLWAVMAYLLGWIALIAVVLIPANESKVDARQKKIDDWVEQETIKQHFKSLDSVDALFNKLDKPKGTSNGMPNL